MRNPFTSINSLITGLLNTLYPAACPTCGKSPDTLLLSPICNSCWSKIKQYTGPSCKLCALPLVSAHAHICGQCLKEPPPFSRAWTFGLYEGVLADAIHQFKFYGLKRLSKPLGALLLCFDIQQVDGIVPVPLSTNGLKTRGFNQSLLIARVLAKHSGIPLCMDTLFKQKDTLPQIGLSAKERRSNVRNAFVVKKKVEGLRLLLVDDVMTTGATVKECAKQLRKAGAEEVLVLTLARAGLD